MAKKIRLRMDALRAAKCLFDFWPSSSKPERVHELSGDLEGVFSIDLKQPYRVLFRPKELPTERPVKLEDLWKKIDSVVILRIEDTHG